MFGNIIRKVGKVIGRGLELGGSGLKRLGDIGGSAIKFLGDHGSTIGTIGGAAATLLGAPELAPAIMGAGRYAENVSRSRAAQNVVRGINDVGNAMSSGGQRLS